MKKIIITAALMLAAAGLVFTSGESAQAKVKVNSVKVQSASGSKKIVYVAKGKSVKLNTVVKAKPNKAANKKVTYKSSNSSVVAVNKKGIAKGKKTGAAKITVTSKKNSKKKASIKVKVLNVAASKVNISNKRASVTVGSSVKLKASVKGKKGCCKDIVWTSSKKSIASVSSKGVVKGLKPGRTKIKATAADGSKKSAACNVIVSEKTTDVSGIAFTMYSNKQYTDRIVVSFNQGVALGEGNFEVRTKSRPDGQFMHVENVADVYTYNQTDYIISIEDGASNGIYSGDFVQVSVTGINGNNVISKEFIVNDCLTEDVVAGEVGVNLSYGLGYGYQAINIESGSLPAGLAIDQQDGVIYGIPTAVADNQRCVFVLTDQTGKSEKVEVNFIIGDNSHVIAEGVIVGNRKDNEICSEEKISFYVNVAGGTGTYSFRMEDSCGGLFDVSESVSGVDSAIVESKAASIPAGAYYPKLRVTDSSMNSTVVTLQIIVSPSVKLTGSITNIADNTRLYYQNVESGKKYSYTKVTSLDNSSTSYTVTVPVGTYDVYYLTTNSKGKSKINYLEQNVLLDSDRSFAYNLANAYRIDLSLTMQGGFAAIDYYYAYLINESGRTIMTRIMDYGSIDGSNSGYDMKAGFTNLAAGNYIIRVYNGVTGSYIGETPLMALTANTAQQIIIN